MRFECFGVCLCSVQFFWYNWCQREIKAQSTESGLYVYYLKSYLLTRNKRAVEALTFLENDYITYQSGSDMGHCIAIKYVWGDQVGNNLFVAFTI